LSAANLKVAMNTDPSAFKIVLQKKTDSNNTVYGAFNFSKNFSILPSLFRFSWEKMFYGVENESGLSDPAYDQKIETDQAYSAAGPYIRLLIPKNPLLQFSAQQRKTLSKAPEFSSHKLTIIQNEFKKDNFTTKDIVLSFKPSVSTLTKKARGKVWLIRFTGDEKPNNQSDRLILWTSLNFSANKSPSRENDISYLNPWLPNYLTSSTKKSGEPLHFDVCFPILIDAFNEPLKTIDLHLLRKDTADQAQEPPPHRQIECSFQIYEMNKSLPGIQYEIL
jgi:hypothetical protein